MLFAFLFQDLTINYLNYFTVTIFFKYRVVKFLVHLVFLFTVTSCISFMESLTSDKNIKCK